MDNTFEMHAECIDNVAKQSMSSAGIDHKPEMLAAQGVFPLGNAFWCVICHLRLKNLKAILNHTLGKWHSLKLEKANVCYTKENGCFSCRLCTSYLSADWQAFLIHFKENQHFEKLSSEALAVYSPNSDVPFSYVTLVKNSIIEFNTGIFCCCCCKEVVVGKDLIHRHIVQVKHELLKNNGNGDTYAGYEREARKLVKNLVTVVTNSQFHCNLCHSLICGKNSLTRHIFSDKHMENILTTENTDHPNLLKNIKPNKSLQIRPPNLTQVEISKSFDELMRRHSIIESSQIDKYRCELCSCTLDGQKVVSRHVLGKQHNDSMKRGGNVMKLNTKSDQTSAGSSSSWESTDNSLEGWEIYGAESQSSESFESSSHSCESSDDTTDIRRPICIQGLSLDSQGSKLFKISSNLMPLISKHGLHHLEKEIFCSLCLAHLKSEQCLINHTKTKRHMANLNRHKDQIAKKNKKESSFLQKNNATNSSNCQTSQPGKKYGLSTDKLIDAVVHSTSFDVPVNLISLMSEHMLQYQKGLIFCPACQACLHCPRLIVEHTRSENHIRRLNSYKDRKGKGSKESTDTTGGNSSSSLCRDTMNKNNNNKSSDSIDTKNDVSSTVQKPSKEKPQSSQFEVFQLPDYLIPMFETHSLQYLKQSVFCQACQFHMRHENTLLEHMTGKNHAVRLSSYKAEISSRGESSQSIKFPKTNSAENSSIHVVTEKQTNVKPSSKSIAPNLQKSQTSLMDIPKKLLPLIGLHSLKHLENEIYCVACQVQMTNISSLVNHVSSHIHAARLESFRANTSNENKNIEPSMSLKSNVVVSCKELKLMEQNLKKITNVSENEIALVSSSNKLTITRITGENSKKLPQLRSKNFKGGLAKNRRTRRQDTRPKQSRPFAPRYLKVNMEHIYEINAEKLRILKLSCQLCFPKTSNSVYCLICEKTVVGNLQNFYEDILGKAHTTYLAEAEQNEKHFIDYPDQFSDLTLAKEFMQESQEETIQCFACDESLKNEDVVIYEHIRTDLHSERKQLWNKKMEKILQDILAETKSTWYNIQKYWCVFCDVGYNTEFQFAEHIDGKKHDNCVKKIGAFQDRLVYDSCISCATLWLGLLGTYAQHCEQPMHKYLVRTGDYSVCKLPNQAKTLLENAVPEVDSLIELSDQVTTVQKVKTDALLECLENTVEPVFPNVKAYPFGSRVSGLGFPDSDIDVFLDCGTYDGDKTTRGYQEHLIKAVEGCLYENQKSWEVEETLVSSRTPIIKLRHRDTELRCDVSFKNGLGVENTKLLKYFIDNYPLCRTLMLFLKKWLALCNLSGSHYITNYANCMYVIFYLQSKSILPSVASLIAKENKSKLIDGWETGISARFHVDQQEFTFTELLHGFFEFYSKFDFRDSVACPLLGRAVPKQDFTELDNLPKEMAPYVKHVTMKSIDGSAELFRIDSEMCVQDPFDLSYNLTKAVKKFTLNRFRRLCATSAEVLNDFIEH